jgi:hypothetical protein
MEENVNAQEEIACLSISGHGILKVSNSSLTVYKKESSINI